jgi:putative acetyltransferase
MTVNTLTIRPEQAADQSAIYDLTKRAFASMPYAGGDEQDLINTLRAGGALTLSLVAVEGDKVIGHVAFSPATAADGSPNWFALGPVSVGPEVQNKGIGALLIREGIDHLKAMNAAGCILTGNPKYYTRFGFLPFPDLAPAREPSQYFMILPLVNPQPVSVMAFHPLFYAKGAVQH